MSLSMLIFFVLLCMGGAYHVALHRSKRMALQLKRGSMHSQPHHHALLVAIWCGAPALITLLLWHFFTPQIITALVLQHIPETITPLTADATHAWLQRTTVWGCSY